ncbi:putative F-box protein [Raphanus sativus]|nr:putative F-box protein [Raphanus sativus]
MACCYAHPKSNMLVLGTRFQGKPDGFNSRSLITIAPMLWDTTRTNCAITTQILRLPCYYDHGKPESWKKLDVTTLEGDLRLEIYEFGSNSWRSLDAVTTQAFLQPCGVSLKGDTYWLSSNHKVFDYSLLSFDFSKESLQRLCVS